MPLVKLEDYQKQLPELGDLLPKFDEYLEASLSAAEQRGRENFDIVPAQLAKKLNIKEGLALALLMIAEEQGVVEARYQVYCPTTDAFIAEFNSLSEVPKKIECDHHERPTVHDSDEYLLDVVFRFEPRFFEHQLAMAVHS